MSAKQYERQQATWARRRATIRALRQRGLSAIQIGRQLRISRTRVYQVLAKDGA
jgi:hypothetical protein